jgi:hypothetical protein
VFGTNGTSQVFVDKDAFLYVPTSVSAYGYGWANYSSAIGLTPNEGDHIVFYPGGNKVAQVRATGFGIMLEAGNPFSFVDNYNKVFGNSGSDGIEIVTSSGRGIANRTPVLASAFTGRAGTSSQSFNASGFVYVNTSEVGNIGTGEDDLISQTVAANALSSNGSSLRIVAPVVLAANANNKTIKAYWAGVSFYSTGALAINGDVAVFEFIITRTGATSQNITTRVVCGDSLMSPVSSDFDTGSATLSSANVFKLTGEATDDNDILNKQLTIEFLPSP